MDSEWSEEEMDRDMPEPTPPSESGHPTGEAEFEHREDAPSLIAELQTFGQLVAAALRAAATTPEAEALRNEVREGVTAMESEIREQAAARKESTRRASTQYRETGTVRVRTDLAAALRSLNRAMGNLAESLEPEEQTGPGAEAKPPEESPGVEGEVGGGPVADKPEAHDS